MQKYSRSFPHFVFLWDDAEGRFYQHLLEFSGKESVCDVIRSAMIALDVREHIHYAVACFSGIDGYDNYAIRMRHDRCGNVPVYVDEYDGFDWKTPLNVALNDAIDKIDADENNPSNVPV